MFMIFFSFVRYFCRVWDRHAPGRPLHGRPRDPRGSTGGGIGVAAPHRPLPTAEHARPPSPAPRFAPPGKPGFPFPFRVLKRFHPPDHSSGVSVGCNNLLFKLKTENISRGGRAARGEDRAWRRRWGWDTVMGRRGVTVGSRTQMRGLHPKTGFEYEGGAAGGGRCLGGGVPPPPPWARDTLALPQARKDFYAEHPASRAHLPFGC